jgi:trans-aconitate methyltransferase
VQDWTAYYDATGEAPRETLVAALDAFDAPGFAVDLGCGNGRDTVELVRRGWRVLAIDGDANGIARLEGRGLPNVETRVASFADATWPACDLVSSSYALPFCAPGDFHALWTRIVDSLPAGGRFAGQLFGDRDGWRDEADMTFHTRAEAEELLRPFELELFDEEEEDGETALGDPKHWHLFHVVARKTL